MITRLPLLLLDIEPAFSPTTIIITALLDFAGLAIAIWTFWSSIWLQRGGQLLYAFRFISLGSLALALSHLLDTMLQLLNIDAATLIHQGAVLLAVLCFLPGLANLTDTLPTFAASKTEQLPRIKLWPLVTALIILVSMLSFVFYGLGLVAEVFAFFILDGSLLILAMLCLALVARAQLGGAIGHSLWLAIVGLMLFSLAHPAQAWFYEQTNYAPDLLGIVHRLIVIPAFLLFAISITHAANALHQSAAA
jgi:hypothetical protein